MKKMVPLIVFVAMVIALPLAAQDLSLFSYFISVDGEAFGPYTGTDMERFVGEGRLSGDSFVWREGMVSWMTAETVPELASLFVAPPHTAQPPEPVLPPAFVLVPEPVPQPVPPPVPVDPPVITQPPAPVQTAPVFPTAPPARLVGVNPEAGSSRLYRLRVGSFRNSGNAINAFSRLREAGLNPAYERYEDLYRVVLPNIRAEEIPSITQILGNLGFQEALVQIETPAQPTPPVSPGP